ncbi:MAG: methyltransferase domain-containing protein [Candidatus Bathyarchaeia archaeon]
MKWMTKHVGLTKVTGELQFKRRLDNHALGVLTDLGVKVGDVVLDFGCGSGTYTIAAAKLVGMTGRVYALDINSRALDTVESKARQEGLKNIVRIDASGEEAI